MTRGFGLRLIPFATFFSLAVTSVVVSANPISLPTKFDMTSDLVIPNFPINGLLLLVMYFLFVRMDGPPVQEGMVLHFVAFMISVAILTFSGALIDTVAFLSDDIGIYITSAALIACISAGVSMRYLHVPLHFSLIIGLVFFVTNMVAWLMVDDWFWEKVSNVGTSLFFIGLLVVLLLFEGYFYHNLPPQPPRPEPGEEAMTARRVRVRRLRSWFLREWVLIEAFLFSLILLYMAIYISMNPVFNFP